MRRNETWSGRHGGVLVRGLLLGGSLFGLLLGGCDDPKEPAKADAVADASDGADDAAEDVEDTAVGTDAVAEDTTDAAAPEVVDTAIDVPEAVDTAECATATDCKNPVKACEQTACVEGACQVVAKPGTCCADADCDDKIECTADKCDTSTSACLNQPIVNCCSGKVTLVKTGFETGTLEDFKATEGPSNGNVGWQPSGKRVHGGKTSIYLGNACGTYDNSMTVDNACTAGPEATAVTSALQSKEYALPKEKKAQLHFWLFLEAEPAYADTLPKGNCAQPCALGSACIFVNGTDQCVPEKDVLQVNVQAGDVTVPVFHSTSIGKTTKAEWQHVAIDLSPWAGQSVKLQWTFQTGTGLKNGFEGVYLDDVVVETICATEGTVCDQKTPCPDDALACTVDVCTPYANTPGAGVCFFDKLAGCCQTTGDCDDGNACTVDACVAGQCQAQPDVAKPGCCKPEVLVFDDFDTGVLTGWTPLGLNSNIVKWRIFPAGGTAGSQALYFGDESFTHYDDPSLGSDAGPKGTLCTKPVKLKTGTLFDLVSFDLQLETEWSGLDKSAYANPPSLGAKKYDVFEVRVFHDGNFTPVWSSDAVYGTTEGQFVPVTASLDAFQGQTVQICLFFDAGDGQVNDKLGVVVDNFVVKVACSKKACYFDSECAQMTCGGACETPACTDAGCACTAVPGCCAEDKDCNDGDDKCTVDKCADGKCLFEPSGAEGC